MGEFVGYSKTDVIDGEKEITFPMLVLYPTSVPSKPAEFGPFTLDVSIEAPVAEGTYPIVIISHGSGGSNLAHRTIGEHLAKNGFIVCMPEHPFNNRNNNDLEYTIENMENRPRHIRLALDSLLDQEKFKNHANVESVAIIGHSVGGYTALALAGGVPNTQFLIEFSKRPEGSETPDWCRVVRKNLREPQDVKVKADARIKALVLLAPDVSLFMSEGALQNVTVPVLMLGAEKDFSPLETADLMAKALPENAPLSHGIVENAGHYSFLSPFPEAIRDRVGEAARDPEGFDREEFHGELNDAVLGFLGHALSPG